jgi:hypothetical protein
VATNESSASGRGRNWTYPRRLATLDRDSPDGLTRGWVHDWLVIEAGLVCMGCVPRSGDGALGGCRGSRRQCRLVHLDVPHAGAEPYRHRRDSSRGVLRRLRPVPLGEESDVHLDSSVRDELSGGAWSRSVNPITEFCNPVVQQHQTSSNVPNQLLKSLTLDHFIVSGASFV